MTNTNTTREWLLTGRTMNENGNFRRTRVILSESFTQKAAERELTGHERTGEFKGLKVEHVSQSTAKAS